jgi:N-acetylglucosaminyl-diphospho-decaprenol L-rhamnosyltransferase
VFFAREKRHNEHFKDFNEYMSVDVSILVVSYNTEHLLEAFFQSLNAAIARSPKLSFEVVVIDNASTDESAQKIRELFPNAQLVVNTVNIGFGRANNQAFDLSTGMWVLLLNTDAFIVSGEIQPIITWATSRPNCAVIGAKLVSADSSLQPSCRFYPNPLKLFLNRTGLSRWLPLRFATDDMRWDHDEIRHCDWVPGCFYLLRREQQIMDRVFDPRYFLYYEEVDHCRTMKAGGYSVVFHPGIVVHHIGGESAKSAGNLNQGSKQLSSLQVESELLFFRKWHGFIGLISHLFLFVFGSMILTLKGTLMRKNRIYFTEVFKETAQTLRIAVDTRFGLRPTR